MVEVAERYEMTWRRLKRWLAELQQPEAESIALYVKPGHLLPYLESLGLEQMATGCTKSRGFRPTLSSPKQASFYSGARPVSMCSCRLSP